MRARRSRAASAISSPTPAATSSTPSSTAPISRTGTVPRWCSRRSSTASRGSGTSLLTGGMPDRNCARCSTRSANGRSKSSSDPTPPRGSKCYLGAGSSSAPAHGLIETVASPKTSKIPSGAPPHGSSWLPSNSSPDASQPSAIKQDNYESGSECEDAKMGIARIEMDPDLHRHIINARGYSETVRLLACGDLVGNMRLFAK